MSRFSLWDIYIWISNLISSGVIRCDLPEGDPERWGESSPNYCDLAKILMESSHKFWEIAQLSCDLTKQQVGGVVLI